jgi:hypothetical protein
MATKQTTVAQKRVRKIFDTTELAWRKAKAAAGMAGKPVSVWVTEKIEAAAKAEKAA